MWEGIVSGSVGKGGGSWREGEMYVCVYVCMYVWVWPFHPGWNSTVPCDATPVQEVAVPSPSPGSVRHEPRLQTSYHADARSQLPFMYMAK